MSGKISAKDVLKRYIDEILPEFSGRQLKDVNQRGNLDSYPLNIACTRGNLEEVEALLEAGANVNAQGEDNFTPLHDAAEQGHCVVVKMLLDWGASLNMVNEDGDTAKDLAVLFKNKDVVAILDEYAGKQGNEGQNGGGLSGR